MYISELKNPAAKRLLRKFWGLTDSLHYEIEKIPFDIFASKYIQLLNMLDKAGKLEGCPITVNLDNLIEQARGKYGHIFDDKFSPAELELECLN